MKCLYGAALVLIVLASEGLADQLVNGDFEMEAIVGAGQSPVPPGAAGKKLINNPSDPGYANAILEIPSWINSFEAAGWRDSGLGRANFDGSGTTQYAFINNWETRLSQVSSWNIAPSDSIQADILVGFDGPLKAGRFQLWAGAPNSGNPDTFPGSAVLLAEFSAATPDWTNYVPDQSLSMGQWHPLQLNYTAPASGPMIGQPLTVSFLTSSGSAGPTYWDNASLTVALGPTVVPGTANLWLAGMPNGSAASFDTAPFASPALVASTDIVPGATYSFTTTGTVRHGPDPLTHFGPEGNESGIIPHEFGVENGIGVLTAPLNSLIGVFLDSSQPDGTPAPTGLNFSDPASRNYLTLAPELKQPFFIGDGLTDLSDLQQIIAPAGATRLFLGTQDGSGWFNNEGSFSVEVARVANVFEWNNSLGGQFAEGSNWDVGSVPGPTSEIVFNIPGTYEVDFANDESNAILTVRQGNVTFDLATTTQSIDPGAAVVGDQAGDTASLRLVGGAAEYNAVYAGKNSGSNGTVTVDGAAAQLTTNAINVGSHGQGTLSIENGGKLSSAIGRVASEVGSQGNVMVGGAGSQWSVGQNLFVGGNESSAGGTGALTVSLDGAVTVADFLTVWSAGTVDVSGGGRISIGGEALPAQGTVHVGSGGALSGNGTVIGNVANPGLIGPGPSTGILTIDGNLTQTSTSFLIMEVGGPTPGSQHDKLIVTGSATIGGQLDVSIADGYVPQAGDSVTILTSPNVTGDFATVFAPELVSLNPNVAIQVERSDTDVQLHFVTPLTDTQFAPNNGVIGWDDSDAWSTGAEPDSRHVLILQSPTGFDQIVEVESGDAFAHELTIDGDSNNTMTLVVKNGKSISTTADMTVGQYATAELGSKTRPGRVSARRYVNLGTTKGNFTFGPPSESQTQSELRKRNEKRNALTSKNLQPGNYSGNYTPNKYVNKAKTRPGESVGLIVIDGDFEQESDGELEIELESPSSFDRFVITGEAKLAGTLDIVLLNFMPQLGNSFDFIDWETVTGTFDTLQLPMLGGGLTWDTDQLYTLGVLAIGGLLGDYNLDSIVDAADYVLWRKSVGQVGSGLATDGNRNNLVDDGDYNVWREHFGDTAASGTAAHHSAVPEPSGILILGTIGFWIVLTRRRCKGDTYVRNGRCFNLATGARGTE